MSECNFAWCSWPLDSQPSMCQGVCCSCEAVTVGVTCCCVCALGDSTMHQCLCGCDSRCMLFPAVLGYPEWGALEDFNVPPSLMLALALCWHEVIWAQMPRLLWYRMLGL